MLTYQVKITVDKAIEAEWLLWMKTEHVPDVIATGLIKSFQIMKPEESDGVYLFHYHFSNDSDYEEYQKNHAPALKAHVANKFPHGFEAERAILRWI